MYYAIKKIGKFLTVWIKAVCRRAHRGALCVNRMRTLHGCHNQNFHRQFFLKKKLHTVSSQDAYKKNQAKRFTNVSESSNTNTLLSTENSFLWDARVRERTVQILCSCRSDGLRCRDLAGELSCRQVLYPEWSTWQMYDVALYMGFFQYFGAYVSTWINVVGYWNIYSPKVVFTLRCPNKQFSIVGGIFFKVEYFCSTSNDL